MFAIGDEKFTSHLTSVLKNERGLERGIGLLPVYSFRTVATRKVSTAQREVDGFIVRTTDHKRNVQHTIPIQYDTLRRCISGVNISRTQSNKV